MKNPELITMLEKVKYWEDDFILKYANESFLELLQTLPPEKFKKINKLVQENIRDTRKHKQLLEGIINDINGDSHGK